MKPAHPLPDRTMICLEEVKPASLRELCAVFMDGLERGWHLHRETVLQATLALLSLAAIALISTTGTWQRWGFVVGLLSQPLWIHATWRARQWGMFALSCVYVPVWIGGIAARFF